MKSITKALNILELFLDSKEEMSLGDIAKSTKLDITTVFRVVSTLVDHGFLKQKKKKGKYSLGVRCIDFNEVINKYPEKSTGTISYLVKLSKLVGENTSLFMWCGSDFLRNGVFSYDTGSLKLYSDDWGKLPLHGTCVGKIALASMSDGEIKSYFRKNLLERLTTNTIVDIDMMMDHLSAVRREGVAFEEEECRLGMNGVAAAVKNSEGETLGAILISGSSRRLTPSMLRKIAPSIKGCAVKISNELASCNLLN